MEDGGPVWESVRMYCELADPAATLDLTQMTILAQYLQMQQKNGSVAELLRKKGQYAALTVESSGDLRRVYNDLRVPEVQCALKNIGGSIIPSPKGSVKRIWT